MSLAFDVARDQVRYNDESFKGKDLGTAINRGKW